MGSKLYARDMHCSRLAETGHVFTAAGQGYRLYRVVDETTGELENVGHYATWDAMVAAAQADTTFDTDERVSIGGEHPADDGHAYQIVTVGSVPHVRFVARCACSWESDPMSSAGLAHGAHNSHTGIDR